MPRASGLQPCIPETRKHRRGRGRSRSWSPRLERAEAGEGVAVVHLAGWVLRHRPAHVDRVPDLPAFRTGGGGGLGGAGPPEGPAPRNLVHVALRAFWGHPSASPLAGRGGPGTRPWRTPGRPGNGRRAPRTRPRYHAPFSPTRGTAGTRHPLPN